MKFSECIICGKKDPEFDKFCMDCFKNDNPLIIKRARLRLTFCIECGSVHLDDGWYKPEEGSSSHVTHAIVRIIELRYKFKRNLHHSIDLLRYEYVFFGDAPRAGVIRADIKYQWFAESESKIPLEETESVEIVLRWRICEKCAAAEKHGYSAKIQLRGIFPQTLLEDIRSYVAELKARGDDGAQIVRIEELKEGNDVYIISKKVAKRVTEFAKTKLPCKITETTEQLSYDSANDKEVTRLILSIRFPSFIIGDFVCEGDNIYQITSIHSGQISVFDFKSKTDKIFHPKLLWDANFRLMLRYTDLHEFQVISMNEKDDIAEVMVLSNYETKYVEKKLLKSDERGVFRGYINDDAVIFPSQV